MPDRKISRSLTRSVDLCVSQQRAFDFLSDLANWPRWAVVNIKSVAPGVGGWYYAETRRGGAQLRLLSGRALGVLDHMWKTPRTAWTVPARLVPNRQGCTFMVTLFQPPGMDNAAFDAAAGDLDAELRKLKEVLEEKP